MIMDTAMTDFRLEVTPAWPDDITYCSSEDCTAACWRHQSKIDWELAKHKYLGASIAEFGPVCTSYKTGGESNA